MNNSNGSLKVLAINSFPANGNAGLKIVLSVLGTRVIPVPTLLLTGIGSIPGFQKFPVPFESLLAGSLQLARQRNDRLIVYIGYLGAADQVNIISGLLNEYTDSISQIVVDPVCGDNGKAYVPEDIIAAWPQLLTLADIALPNLTEVALLLGATDPVNLAEAEQYLNQYLHRFPQLLSVITSWPEQGQMSNRLYENKQLHTITHQAYPTQLAGTGDLFASLFIHFYCYMGSSAYDAVDKAGRYVAAMVEKSLSRKSIDVVIDPINE